MPTDTSSPAFILESFSASSFFLALFFIIGAIVLSRLIDVFKGRIHLKFPDFRLQIEQFATVCKFLVLVIGVAIGVGAFFQFSKEVMITIGGSLAVAIGFGLKDVAASILSGFLILFERPFQVGDRIAFGDTYGDVISIGLRSTQVRTLDDSIVTIPNNRFITDTVSSANAGVLDMMAQVDLYIEPHEDLQAIEQLVREAVLMNRYVFLQKPFNILFSDVIVHEIFCTRIRVKAYVVETKYEKPFESELVQSLHLIFAEKGIKLPRSISPKTA